MFKLILKGKDLGCNYELWWGLGDCCSHTHGELLNNIIETQYVIYSVDGLWITNFLIFHFGFLHFKLHMFDMFNYE